MNEVKEFIVSNETEVNTFGFKLRNSGGRFERFNANPVMLHNHNYNELTGKWLNLRIEGKFLKATPEFDEGNAYAMDKKGQVERGYLKGASVGIVPLKWESDENGTTCTEWELLEISTTPVPSNAGALRLYHPNGNIMNDSDIKLSIQGNKNQNIKQMNEITLSNEAANTLQIGVNSTAREISAAIMELSAAKEKAENELKEWRQKAELQAKQAAEKLVDSAIKEGRLTADRRESMLKLAVSDHTAAAEIIATLPKPGNISGQITESTKTDLTAIPSGRENWTFTEWQKKDTKGLMTLKAQNPDAYLLLYKTSQQNKFK